MVITEHILRSPNLHPRTEHRPWDIDAEDRVASKQILVLVVEDYMGKRFGSWQWWCWDRAKEKVIGPLTLELRSRESPQDMDLNKKGMREWGLVQRGKRRSFLRRMPWRKGWSLALGPYLPGRVRVEISKVQWLRKESWSWVAYNRRPKQGNEIVAWERASAPQKWRHTFQKPQTLARTRVVDWQSDKGGMMTFLASVYPG